LSSDFAPGPIRVHSIHSDIAAELLESHKAAKVNAVKWLFLQKSGDRLPNVQHQQIIAKSATHFSQKLSLASECH